jgi:hypothetical protein
MTITSQLIPDKVQAWSKNRKKNFSSRLARSFPEDQHLPCGEAFSELIATHQGTTACEHRNRLESGTKSLTEPPPESYLRRPVGIEKPISFYPLKTENQV